MITYFQAGWVWCQLGKVFTDLPQRTTARMSREEFRQFVQGYLAYNELVNNVNYGDQS